MTSANGKLKASELTSVDGVDLSTPTANAYRRLKAAAKAAGVTVSIVLPDGGYRSLATQKDMAVHPGKHNLDPASTISIAAVGFSSHGWGTRVDLLPQGGWVLANAAKFGFTREFGAADPKHYMHDGKTAVGPLTKETTMDLVRNPAGTTYALEFPFITDGIPGDLVKDLVEIAGPVQPMSAEAEDWLRAQIAKAQKAFASGGTPGAAPTAAAVADGVLARLRTFWNTGK